MSKTLAAVGFFLIGLALVGAGIAAFFTEKPILGVLSFVLGGVAATLLCSLQKNDHNAAPKA